MTTTNRTNDTLLIEMAAALSVLLFEHEALNAFAKAHGRGLPDDSAHPDCGTDMARVALADFTRRPPGR